MPEESQFLNTEVVDIKGKKKGKTQVEISNRRILTSDGKFPLWNLFVENIGNEPMGFQLIEVGKKK